MVRNLKYYMSEIKKTIIKNFFRKSTKCSHLDGIIDGVVFGWLISSKDSPSVDILINGKKVDEIKDFMPDITINLKAYRFYHDLKKYNIKQGDEIELRSNTGKIKGTPIKLSKENIFGLIEGFSGYECFGWAGTVSGEIPRLKFMIDGEIFEPELSWQIRDDFSKKGIITPTGFRFKIPEKFLDGNIYKISLYNPNTHKRIGKEYTFRFQIKNFFIDLADSNAISGWLQVEDYPGPIELDIYIENEKIGTTKADYPREDAIAIHGSGCYGFSFPIPDSLKEKNLEEYKFSIYLSNTSIKLIDEHKIIPLINIIEKIEKVSQINREKGDKNLCFYLKESLELARKNFKNISLTMKNAIDGISTVDVVDVVDVIIPVYKGREETLECIESVLNAKTNVNYELIVINDSSPDVELSKALQKLSAERKITLIENKENLGFVKSVNIGMKLHPNRDVVLLNSDTLVPDYWLDRLRKVAYSSKNIATVTPLSNRATILSIPNPNEDNDLPLDLSYKELDEICKKVNDGSFVDIPTAIGFCMYIKRECINEVGYFDEEKFGKGYGEENDFCLRASALGWRHIASLDLFVQHHGSLSFGDEKPERVKKALEIINQLYPDYPARIQKFIKKDPVAPFRNKIVKEIIKRKYASFVIFIIHSWGGGSFKYCLDLAKLLHDKEIGSIFILHQNNQTILYLKDFSNNLNKNIKLLFPHHLSIKNIVQEIKDLSILFVHYNQTMNFKSLDIWQLHEWFKVPYYITIHDYFYLCPRIFLINSGGIFCGLPEPEVCEECLSYGNLEKDIEYLYQEFFDSSILKWRKFYENCINGAKKVIFPSETTLKYYQKIFNLKNYIIYPHPEKIKLEINPYKKEKRLKIALIGAIGENKGYYPILRLIDYSEKNKLPFDFIFIGYTKDDEKIKGHKNVKLTGPYKEEELPYLINAYKPDLALFLHIWPETYNYTLSEALKNGLYPVVYDIGAPAERIKKLNIGTLIPYPSTTENIAKILLELYNKGWETRGVFINNEYNIMEEYYEI